MADPCGPAKEKGFSFSMRAHKIRVAFRDREVAHYTLGSRNPAFMLSFSDFVPREAHEPIASVFSAMRETAERVSRLLSADLRALETQMDPLWGTRDQVGWFDVPRNDALRALRALPALGLPIEQETYRDAPETFSVNFTARSEAFPENAILIHPLYVRDRSTVHDFKIPGFRLLSEEVIGRILNEGLTAYHRAADFTPDGSRGQGMTDKARIVWSNLIFDQQAARRSNATLKQPFMRTAEVEGFSVRLDKRVAQVLRNGVVLLEAALSRDNSKRPFVDRDLGPDRLGHLYRILRDGANIALRPNPQEPEPVVRGPEDILRAATEIDRGYAM